jgi:2-methylcitrate dehydratase PrpD
VRGAPGVVESGLTRGLAAWVSQLRFEDLPDAVVATVIDHLVDAVAAMHVGSGQEWTRRTLEYASSESPDGRSVVVGGSRRLRPEWAALVNGTAAHGFEIDDYALPGLSHPGSVVAPTALAVGDDIGADGRSLITALAAGFELVTRFGTACSPEMTSTRGFHVTSAFGVFGAAAVTASIHRSDEETTLHSLALAAAHASGGTEFTRTGGDVKRLHAGMAAAAGIRSAALARTGLTGPTAAIEGERGFLQGFVPSPRSDALSAGLGQRWELDGLAMKRWCVCAGLQAPLVAATRIRERGISVDDIAEIIVEVDAVTLGHTGQIGAIPPDATSAQMSLHHALALAFSAGGNDPAHYATYWSDAKARAVTHGLGERVRAVFSAQSDAVFPARLSATVTIRTVDGDMHSETADAPGTGGSRPSSAAYDEKLVVLAAPEIGAHAAARVIDTIRALPVGGDCRGLTELLGKEHDGHIRSSR